MKKSKMVVMAVIVCICTAMFGWAVYADEKAPAVGVLPEGVTLRGESLAGKTVEEAKAAVAECADAILNGSIQLNLVNDTYELSMEELGMTWLNADAADVLDGKELKGNVISRYKQTKDVEHNPIQIEIQTQYDEEKLAALVEQYVTESTTEVTDASLKRVDGVFAVVNERKGTTFDLEQVQQDVQKLVQDGVNGTVEYIADAEVVEPKKTVDEYDGFRGDILGCYTTYYKSSDQNRSNNIRLAATYITGHCYLPGEEFSMLDLIGTVAKETGYMEAGTYENGRVVQGIGGGICQMATTIYDAALRAEMEITERRPHSMVASYVPFSWDAMVYAQDGRDFKFINNTDYPIYVEIGVQEGGVEPTGGYEGDSALMVYIYGTETRPENRTFEFRSVTKDLQWPNTFNMPMYNVTTDSSLPAHTNVEIAAVHPYVVAECWKDIYVDGELVDSIQINKSQYDPGTGVMSISPDLTFEAWPVPDEKTGWTKVHHEVKWKDAEAIHQQQLQQAKEEEKRQQAAAQAAHQAALEAAQQAAAQAQNP